MMRNDLVHQDQLGHLVAVANRVCAETKIDAAHISAMMDDPGVELLVALWTDFSEPDGLAAAALKGAEIVTECEATGHRRTLSTLAFWVRNEEHLLALGRDVAKLVEEETGARGEFAPIADDLAFEFVPNGEDVEQLFVTKSGGRIARRGRPETPEARRWVPLIPGCTVRDITPTSIEVCIADVARMYFDNQVPPLTAGAGAGAVVCEADLRRAGDAPLKSQA
jgi:hypothetical protein